MPIRRMSAAVVAAAQESGIGLTLLPVLYRHAGFGGQAPSAGQARFLHDLDGFARLLDAARGHGHTAGCRGGRGAAQPAP
jgi:cytosine/adenosine deaminase-related metal-dependent hydrolase